MQRRVKVQRSLCRKKGELAGDDGEIARNKGH